ncbi:opacity-associated protein A [[Actinobacillus] rossii]|uniref:Opacity-associated protein A n=1 Tax=[Actinobacillus] rossii TaxID=123820 RepID=A0A380TQQ9_9PAST|nr:opacity-associated protein A [[Actinobacillus] rossii]
MDNKPENHSASNQNELDLGLNQVEPVTPKKAFTPDSSSFLNKFFGKKEAAQANPFAERKEPTFGSVTGTEPQGNQPTHYAPTNTFTPTTKPTVEPAQETIEKKLDTEEIKVESAVENTFDAAQETVEEKNERPIQAAEEPIIAAKSTMENPENWGIMQKLPQKHRRLIIAITGAIAVLVALLLLKPSSDTVDEFQVNNNGNNMPIEFQSLDPNKPVENADMANTTQPAEPPVAEQNQAAPTTAPAVDNTQATPAQAVQPEAAPALSPAPNTAQTQVDTQVPATQATPAKETQVQAEKAQAQAEKTRQEQLAREQQLKARAEKAKAEQLAKAKVAAEKAKAEKLAAEKARAQAALNGAPISEAKPVSAPATTKANATSKTLTVPAGTSLFQVFRTNGLNISDVNAMTKASGVGNALSSFKPGDKVQVSTNSEGRVSSMRLSDGSTFTRQADGSYKYSK